MPKNTLSAPFHLRRGGLKADEAKSIASGAKLIELMSKELGLDDLGETRLLDMGCGVKLAQAFISRDLPIREYVGIDVYREMIDYLNEQVDDSRFHFHHMNAHNEMYNTEGELLTDKTPLPVEDAYFDVISLFSVFTHLAPHDYVSMLKVLRPYVKPGGKLIFSVFIREQSAGGHGLIDVLGRAMEEQGAQNTSTEAPGVQNTGTEEPDFVDINKEKPLQWAMYSKKHALELVEGTGWEIESVNDPLPHIQHYIICKPV